MSGVPIRTNLTLHHLTSPYLTLSYPTQSYSIFTTPLLRRSFAASEHTDVQQFLSAHALSGLQFSARDGLTLQQSMHPTSATASIAVVHVNKPPVAASAHRYAPLSNPERLLYSLMYYCLILMCVYCLSFAIAGAFLSMQLTGADQDSAIASACITSLPQNGSIYQVR
jgi:hypothetical protein